MRRFFALKQIQNKPTSVETSEASYLTYKILMYFKIFSGGYVLAFFAFFTELIYFRYEKKLQRKKNDFRVLAKHPRKNNIRKLKNRSKQLKQCSCSCSIH